MSLRGMKVGDEIVIGQRHRRAAGRYPVTAVGRKYLTADGERFEIETGQRKGPIYGSGVHAYTILQWERRETELSLLTTANKIGDMCRRVTARLSDEDVKFFDATLRDIAARLEKASS